MYGTIRMHQERTYRGESVHRHEEPGLRRPRRAYGAHAEPVTATADFPAAFARAAVSPTGAVLDLVIDTGSLTPRQSLSAMRALAEKV